MHVSRREVLSLGEIFVASRDSNSLNLLDQANGSAVELGASETHDRQPKRAGLEARESHPRLREVHLVELAAQELWAI